MFKLSAASAAIALIASGSAFAAANVPPAVTAGAYVVTNEFTGTLDPSGTCAGLGLAAGVTFTGVSSVAATDFSKPMTQDLNQIITSGTRGVSHIACTLPRLPSGTAFVKGADKSYTATPSGNSTTTCTNTASGTTSPIAYSLVSSNGTSGHTGAPQTLTTTVFPVVKGSLTSGFRITATNTDLLVGSTLVCAISTDSTYFRGGSN